MENTKVIELYQRGESALTIQKKYHVHYKKVYDILKKAGITRRSHKEKTINAVKLGRLIHSKKFKTAMAFRWFGKKNPRWKPLGTKRKNHDYILVKTKNGWRKEEKIVVEKIIKRKLKKYEVVHHINRNKSDNRPENLFVMTGKQHRSWHIFDNLYRNNIDQRPKLKSNLKTLTIS